MNIILDISSIDSNPNNRTGIARVALNLTEQLNKHPDCSLNVCSTGSLLSTQKTNEFLETKKDLISCDTKMNPAIAKLLRFHRKIELSNNFLHTSMIQIERAIKLVRTPIQKNILMNADIYHSTYARIPKQVYTNRNCKKIITIHDLIPIMLGSGIMGKDQVNHNKRIMRNIHPDQWIISVSEYTKYDFCSFTNHDPQKIIVIYSGVSSQHFKPITDSNKINTVRKKYSLPHGNYLFSLNSLAPHKNIPFLIKSFVDLKNNPTTKDLHLVLGGGTPSEGKKRLEKLKITSNISNQIHFTGFIDESDLPILYSNATAFLFPSLYEGFGLPVLEAMSCGAPVIVSNRTSLPEIVGNAGILIDPTNKDDLCNAIASIVNNSNLQESLSKKAIQRASKFSWEDATNKHIIAYEKALNS